MNSDSDTGEAVHPRDAREGDDVDALLILDEAASPTRSRSTVDPSLFRDVWVKTRKTSTTMLGSHGGGRR